jgi:hypothetical protein
VRYSGELGAPLGDELGLLPGSRWAHTGRCTGNGARRRTGPDARSDTRSSTGRGARDGTGRGTFTRGRCFTGRLLALTVGRLEEELGELLGSH